MGQARKDTTFKQYGGAHSGVRTNIFYEMDSIHIEKVFDYLTDKFGFPSIWRKEWKEFLNKQPRGEEEISLFLRFGYERINPILNALLMRSSFHDTFAKLCEYIIRQSLKTKQ